MVRHGRAAVRKDQVDYMANPKPDQSGLERYRKKLRARETIRLMVSLPAKLVSQVDAKRGDTPRSQVIAEALRKWLARKT